jgi:hypothetical protein
VSSHQYAGCVWAGWSAISAPTGATLSINSSIPAAQTLRDAGVWYSLDNGVNWTLIYQATIRTTQTDNVTLPNNVDLTKLQVMAFMDSHDDMSHTVNDIFVTVNSPATNVAVLPVDGPTTGKFGIFNGGYTGMTFMKNVFVLTRDFWDSGLSTPYSGQIFPTGGNSGGPGSVYPY